MVATTTTSDLEFKRLLEVFRFEHDRIVELWDSAQPRPEHSPNANGML